MRILHTLPDLSVRSGGVSSCVAELVQALNGQDCRTEVLTLRPAPSNDDLIYSSELVHAIADDSRLPVGYSRNFRRTLPAFREFDLWHTNGMWKDVNFYTIYRAWKEGLPRVLSPHGMLYPQALRHSRLKKKIMLELGFRFFLERTSCILVTCEEEKLHYRQLGFRNPVAVIPNPLRLPPYLTEIAVERNPRRIGYLGRFHPRKHIERLIEMRRRKLLDAELYLIGGGEPEYEARLREAAAGDPGIVFTGFLNGKEKFEALASLTALCVPSDFENFGMIVPEALMVGTPVVASRGTPWQDLELHQCGRWVANGTESLAEALASILALPPAERMRMGERGRLLLLEKYEASVVARQMKTLYQWLLRTGNQPEFVDLG